MPFMPDRRALRRPVLGLAVLAALVGVLSWAHAHHARPAPPASPTQTDPAALCHQVTELNRARHDDDPVTTGHTIAVVVGDSYAQGFGLPDPRAQSWPATVGKDEDWTTYVDAVGATGFVNGGFCGSGAFAARLDAVLARHPQVVVVQGGLNDYRSDAAEVGAAAGAVLDRLDEVPTVVVVGPTVPPAAGAQAVGQVDEALRAATSGHHRRYVSALSWTLPYQNDHIHPTVDGHRDYATQVEAGLTG